jgi:hypothetical protein
MILRKLEKNIRESMIITFRKARNYIQKYFSNQDMYQESGLTNYDLYNLYKLKEKAERKRARQYHIHYISEAVPEQRVWDRIENKHVQ